MYIIFGVVRTDVLRQYRRYKHRDNAHDNNDGDDDEKIMLLDNPP